MAPVVVGCFLDHFGNPARCAYRATEERRFVGGEAFTPFHCGRSRQEFPRSPPGAVPRPPAEGPTGPRGGLPLAERGCNPSPTSPRRATEPKTRSQTRAVLRRAPDDLRLASLALIWEARSLVGDAYVPGNRHQRVGRN